MLKEIIEYIDCRIKELSFDISINGLCEIIKKEKLSFPAKYEKKDYKKVLDIDVKNGICYHRLRAAITETDSDDSITGCDFMISRIYPCRFVFIVKKQNHDQYEDSRIANLVSKKIAIDNPKTLRLSLKTDTIDVTIRSINISREEVFSQEIKGVDMFIDYEYSVIGIDYDINVIADSSCLIDC